MNMPFRTIAALLSGLLLLLGQSVNAQLRPPVPSNIDIKRSAPVLTVETAGPNEINLGRTAQFVITVKNAGNTIAEDVAVKTLLPSTVEFQTANPKPEGVQEDSVRFYLGTMQPRETKRIVINLLPTKQGAVELSHKTSFSTSHKSAIRVRKSTLKIVASSPRSADYGTVVPYTIVITNKGDGPAENVTIVPRVPDGIALSERAQKPLNLRTLVPGQSHEIAYNINATTAGILNVDFVATDADGTESVAKTSVRVLRPLMNVEITGPALRHVGRTGHFEIRVTNPGDGPTKAVEVMASIPKGLRVVAIAKAAKYDRDNNTLTWYLDNIQPSSETVLSLRAMATEVGELHPQVVASNRTGLIAKTESTIRVVGRPNLWATVVNNDGATETYQTATFTVLLGNRGSVAAPEVDVKVELPEGLEALRGDDYEISGNVIRFEPVAINGGSQQELTFKATGRIAGSHAVRATFQTPEMIRALIVEGDAFVYDDKQPEEIAERLPTRATTPVTQPVPRTLQAVPPAQTTPTPVQAVPTPVQQVPTPVQVAPAPVQPTPVPVQPTPAPTPAPLGVPAPINTPTPAFETNTVTNDFQP